MRCFSRERHTYEQNKIVLLTPCYQFVHPLIFFPSPTAPTNIQHCKLQLWVGLVLFRIRLPKCTANRVLHLQVVWEVAKVPRPLNMV